MDGHVLASEGLVARRRGDRVVVDEADELSWNADRPPRTFALAVGGKLPGRSVRAVPQQLLQFVEHGWPGVQHGSLWPEQPHLARARLAGVEIGGVLAMLLSSCSIRRRPCRRQLAISESSI